jgi:N-acyl-phosphatidylethanolamine-hydrolysing phospholipase D
MVRWHLALGISIALCACAAPHALTMRPHHLSDGTFRNPHSKEDPGFGRVVMWQLGGYDESAALEPVPAGFAYPNPHEPVDPVQPRVTWVNHSTFLVEVAGVRFLTDPIWSERASPVPWAGPKRRHAPGIPLDAVGTVDFVVVSHDHYDHLDAATVRHFADQVEWFVPLRLAEWFRGLGVTRVRELDWWESAHHGPRARITAVPAQHFSMRGPWGVNATLWTGWVIEIADRRVYFAGDTGYNEHDFREIGRRFGPIDLALIPIGAYSPREVMRSRHVAPSEAVEIHRDVQSRRSVAGHFGTFQQTDEPPEQPPYDLLRALERSGIDPTEFRVLDPGQSINF